MRDAVARTKLEVVAFGRTEQICVNNPTAMAALAIRVLCMTNLKSRRVANSFLNAGGIAAVVRLLKEPTCPMALRHIISTVETLLDWRLGMSKQHGLSPDPVDSFIEAGEEEWGYMATFMINHA
jgi:hypothetical protein